LADDPRIADLELRLRLAEERAAQTVDDARRQAERLRVLSQASHAFAAEVGDPDRLLQTVARTCSRLIGDFSAITLLRDDGQWLQHAAVYHPDPELERAYRAVADATPVRLGEGVMGRVLRDGRPLLLPEVDPETIVARAPDGYRELARRLNVHSFLGVPMHARGRVMGGISLARSRAGASYSDADAGTLQDLADRAALALDNAQLYAQLQRRVVEATAELRAANQELEAFSYSVAHDLRAPLRSIDGFSQALLDDYAGKLGGDGEGYLTHVRESARQMSHLIDDLLQLSRVTRGELHRGSVDFSRAAQGIVARLQQMEPDRRVEIVIQDGLVATGDATLMGAVLENLLGNAWKFTRQRAVARIELGALAGRRPLVYFVRDNGAGFDMAYAHKLFGVFQRLHSAREFEGTGIGLATVQRIVRRHGGRVWAEAGVDQGATVYFTLDGESG
jgi:signal transduction histidine kinase